MRKSLKPFKWYQFWRYKQLLNEYSRVVFNFRKLYNSFVNYRYYVEEGNGIPLHVIKMLTEVFPNGVDYDYLLDEAKHDNN